MDQATIRKQLITAGVRNLRTFGYPDCSAENILTDDIYSQFFVGMLNDNKGKGSRAVNMAIDGLLAEVGKQKAR